MDDKLSSRKRRAVRGPGRKRLAQITEALIGFDAEERRIVAAWGWLDIQAVDVPNGLRIKIRPTLLLFSMSYN